MITILLGGIYKLTVPSHGWFLTILPTFYCFIALKIPGKYCLTIGSQCFTWIYQFLDSCNMSRSQSQLFTPGTKIIKIYVIAFWEGPYHFPLFCSRELASRRPKLPGIEGCWLSLRLQPCWGAI